MQNARAAWRPCAMGVSHSRPHTNKAANCAPRSGPMVPGPSARRASRRALGAVRGALPTPASPTARPAPRKSNSARHASCVGSRPYCRARRAAGPASPWAGRYSGARLSGLIPLVRPRYGRAGPRAACSACLRQRGCAVPVTGLPPWAGVRRRLAPAHRVCSAAYGPAPHTPALFTPPARPPSAAAIVSALRRGCGGRAIGSRAAHRCRAI